MHLQVKRFLLLGGAATAVHANTLASMLETAGLADHQIDSFSNSTSHTPFDTDFPSIPTPWNISIDPQFIRYTNLKVALTRYHTDIDVPPWSEGPPRSTIAELRDFWLSNYSWPTVESQINSRFNHFRTTVDIGSEYNFSEPVKLHFVHHRSQSPNAIPLLFMHGTPGSFLEVEKLIEPLTQPESGQPSFHLVAPSLPGYGFSPAPTVPGMGPAPGAAAMDALMQQLGYDRYVVQAGDYGGIILRYLAAQHPGVVSALSNFFVVAANETDLERYERNETTAEENVYIQNLNDYQDNHSGYRFVMSDLPLQVVVATTDSPLGNLGFNYATMRWLSPTDYVWSLTDVITWCMMYWIPGPYSSMRHYKELKLAGAGRGLGDSYPYVQSPVGILEYPGDWWFGLPLDWAARYGNITMRTVHDRGAHFPSWQEADMLVSDIRGFFGNTSLSNTGLWLD